MPERIIHRGNLHYVREQISSGVMQHPMVKKTVGCDTGAGGGDVFIPPNFQMIVYNQLTLCGKIDCEGQLVII